MTIPVVMLWMQNVPIHSTFYHIHYRTLAGASDDVYGMSNTNGSLHAPTSMS